MILKGYVPTTLYEYKELSTHLSIQNKSKMIFEAIQGSSQWIYI